MASPDPVASGELEEETAIEAADGAVVDILDAGGMAKLGGSCPGFEPLLLA
jgi:hypothetical protein